MVEVRDRVASLPAKWWHALRTCAPPPGSLDVVSKWLVVTRACVQPMTLTAIAIAGLLALPAASFDPALFALAALGLVIAHSANNMINDIFDVSTGLDTATYPRALYAPHPVLAGVITQRGLVVAALAANVLDAAIMVVLFLARGWPVIAFALAGLVISVGYVAPPLRLKSKGLGEPGVFVVWGPLMVGGLYYSAVGDVPGGIWWASLPYALLVTSVLMAKHIDKLPWDANQGIRTVPVLIGEAKARRITAALIAGFYPAVVALIATGVFSPWTLAVVLATPQLRRTVRTLASPKPAAPPDGYPLWPLWYAAWAFVHARRAGALLVVGLLAGVIAP